MNDIPLDDMSDDISMKFRTIEPKNLSDMSEN